MSFDIAANELAELIEKGDVQQLRELGGVEGIAEKVHSDLRNGLDERDFKERKSFYGENVFPEKPAKNFFKLLFEALKETMLILLMVLAVISIILGLAFPEREEGTIMSIYSLIC
jgi:Ca2+-transporting ATPase